MDMKDVDRKRKALFVAYQKTKPMRPPDLSLRGEDGNILKRYVFAEYVKTMKPIDFGLYIVGGWEVPERVEQWLENSATIPGRFSRVLVPYEMFEYSVIGTVTAVETNTARNETKNYRNTRSGGGTTFFCCAKCESDRNFYGDHEEFPFLTYDPYIPSLYYDCYGSARATKEVSTMLKPEEVANAELDGLKQKCWEERRVKKAGFLQKAFDFMGRYRLRSYPVFEGPPMPDCYVVPFITPKEEEEENPINVRKRRLLDEASAKAKCEVEELLSILRSSIYSYTDINVEYKTVLNFRAGRTFTSPRIVYYPMYSGEVFALTKDGKQKAFRVCVDGITGAVHGEQPPSGSKRVKNMQFGDMDNNNN